MIYQIVKCTTCRKKTRLPINKQGITSFGRCTLTNNCRGVLSEVSTTELFNSYNDSSVDWIRSNILYNHTQYTISDTWIINHNLNNYPITNIFIDTGSGSKELKTGFTVTYNNINTLTITFDNKKSGYVQCISRDSYLKNNYVAANIDSPINISYFSNITFAIKLGIAFTVVIRDVYNIKHNIENFPLQPLTQLSPWYGKDTIQYNNQLYELFELNLVDFINTNNLTNQSSIYVDSVYFNNIAVQSVDTESVLILLNDRGQPSLTTAVKFFKFDIINNDTNIIIDNQLYVISSSVEPTDILI